MITKSEYKERTMKLMERVEKEGLDVFIVTGEDSIYYLTGVSYTPLERPFFIILIPKEGISLLVPAMEVDHMSEAPNINKITSYWDYPSPAGEGWAEKLREMLKSRKVIGVEPTLIQEIAKEISDFECRVLPLVEDMRLVKSQDEIKMLRRSASLGDFGMELIMKAAYYGVSELELYSQAKKVQMKAMKGTKYDVLTSSIVTAAWPAPMSAQPHSIPSIKDVLEKGPHIALSLTRVNAYSTECERTFFLEKPDKEAINAFNVMTEARNIAFSMIKPGVGCGDIDEKVNRFLKAEGYEKNLLHRTGHGFGLGTHEGPWIAKGSVNILEKNMVISVEPGIYMENIGGVRHSDTVLVTENGYESLTKYPMDLERMIIKGRKPINRIKGKIIKKII